MQREKRQRSSHVQLVVTLLFCENKNNYCKSASIVKKLIKIKKDNETAHVK